jgi:hypothetical protein
MLSQKFDSLGVALLEDSHGIPDSAGLSYSHVFEHSRADDGIEEAIAER